MAITNNKACWSCLKKSMVLCPELGAGWYKCSKCGATYVEMPEPKGLRIPSSPTRSERFGRDITKRGQKKRA